MNRDKKNIDRLFEQGLKGYKESPPIYSWDRLDAGLGKADKQKTFFYLRLLAASIIILFAFGAGYFYGVYNLDNGSYSQISENDNTELPVVLPSTTEISDVKTDGTKEIFIKEQEPDNVSENNAVITAEVESVNYTSSENSSVVENDNVVLLADNSSSIEIEKTEIRKLEMKEITSIIVEKEVLSEMLANSYQKKNTEILTYYDIETEPLQEYGFEENIVKSNALRWTVGAQVAPIYSYRDISTTYSSGSIANELSYNNTEDPMTSIAAGVDVNYSVSKRVSFQTGMYYSQIGQINNDALSFVEDDGKFLLYSIETSLGVIDFTMENVPSDIREIIEAKDTVDLIDQLNVKVVEGFDIFEVPLMLRYKVLNKKFSINVMGGVSPAFVTNNSAYLEVDAQKYDVENSDNFNSVFFNSSLSLGLEYSFLKKLSINFEPTFKYALSPINKDGDFDYHPYSISWFTGLRYSF